MSEPTHAAACLHACSYNCGRQYDVIVTQVVDGSTMFLCIPCFMSFAHNVMQAMVDPNNPGVMEAVTSADLTDVAYVTAKEGGSVAGVPAPTMPDDEFSFDGMTSE